MVRCVAFVAVLVVLVGGYVVGQQPTAPSQVRTAEGHLIAPIHDGMAHYERNGRIHYEEPTKGVSRYVPAESGRMLDTFSGTLDVVSQDGRWLLLAKIRSEATAPSVEQDEEAAELRRKEGFERIATLQAKLMDRGAKANEEMRQCEEELEAALPGHPQLLSRYKAAAWRLGQLEQSMSTVFP